LKILFLTQVLPYPLDAGPKVRAYHMLRWLAERHEVTLVSFVRGDDTPEALAHLRGICAAVHAVPMRRSAWHNVAAGIGGLATGRPVTIVRDEMPEMAALLRKLVAQPAAEGGFDVVHADQLSMAWWSRLAIDAAARAGRPVRSLLDEHNAIYLLTERMAANERRPLHRLIMRREARAFRAYEAAMLRSHDAILTVTEEDRGHLQALLREAGAPRSSSAPDLPSSSFLLPSSITVVPICVDPEQVAVVPREGDGPPRILHLGTMFWPPNVAGVLWFAREVLPRVWETVPEARFVIVGKNPPAEVVALGADPRIAVTGYAADARPYLAAADAFVVPLHAGGGMRVKILDAWLWGLPVVSTTIGAEGIEVRDGENILIADGAEAFAGATVRVLRDGGLNAQVRGAGRAWVEEKYAWRVVYARVDAVYDELGRKAAAGPPKEEEKRKKED